MFDGPQKRFKDKGLFIFPPLMYLVCFLVIPLCFTFWAAAFEGDKTLFAAIQHVVSFPLYRQVLLNTVWISLLVTGTTLLLGYPIAFLLTHASPRGEKITLAILISSMWLSILIRTYAWTILLQREGVVNVILQTMGITSHPISFMFSRFAVVVGMTHVLLPYMVLVIWTSMKEYSERLERVAYSFGATRTFYFFRVFLPVSKTGVTAGVLLVFLFSIGFYITPELLGGGKGRTMMIAMLIEQQINLGQWQMSAALAVVLLVFILALVGVTWTFREVRSIWSELFSGGAT